MTGKGSNFVPGSLMYTITYLLCVCTYPDECGPEMNAWEQSSACESLLEIASSILLARSCDQNVESYDMKGSRACSAGDCEIFLPMNNEVCGCVTSCNNMLTFHHYAIPHVIAVLVMTVCNGDDLSVLCCDSAANDVLPPSTQTLEVMRRHMETLHQQGVPLCIEVKGQGESAGLLLEQWTLQTSSKRCDLLWCIVAYQLTTNVTVILRSAGPVIPLTFLTQAVSSYLHFSQLRSWIVAGEGGLPFEVLYRCVCVCVCGHCHNVYSQWEH